MRYVFIFFIILHCYILPFKLLTFKNRTDFEDYKRKIECVKIIVPYHQCYVKLDSGAELYSIMYSERSKELLVNNLVGKLK